MFRIHPHLVLLVSLAIAGLSAPVGVARANGEDIPLSAAAEARINAWLQGADVLESTWSGDAELGYLSQSGNTNATAAHARMSVVNDRPSWRHALRLEGVYTETEPDPPAEVYRATHKSAFKLTPDDYLLGSVRYDRAVAQGIRYRFAEVVGYGRRLFHVDGTYLIAEIGAGGRQTQRTDQEELQKEAIGVLIGEFRWQIAETSRLDSYLLVEGGDENTFTLSQTGLLVTVRGNLSARFGYEVAHNTHVPEGVERIDRTTSVTLVYRF